MTMTFDAQAGLSGQNLGQTPRQDLETGGRGWPPGLRVVPKVKQEFSDASSSLLTKVIEGEIIPRLLLAHRNLQQSEPHQDDVGAMISCEAFARLVLVSEPQDIIRDIQTLLDRGVTLESIFIDLLGPVARQLGQFWEEDHCTFTEVTLGLMRLHQVLHEIGRRNADVGHRAVTYRACFVPVPGEQHTFGVCMLEEFFRHAGWQTSSDHAPTAASILKTAATQSLDVIGFSVGCQELLDPLSDLIDKTRSVSCNPDVAIMVGGGLFIDNRDLAARFGNATIVSDGIHAVQVAEEVVSRLRRSGEARKVV